MDISKISLPYPVLGLGDDIEPLPQIIDFSIGQDNNYFYIDIQFNINNLDIEKLVTDGFAEYVCEINCVSTLLRKCFSSSEQKFHVRISKQEVQKTVTIQTAVIVKRSILNYTNNGFHDDYKGYTFNLEPGDVLAVIRQDKFEADVKYDKLKAVGSFMEINEQPDGKGTAFNLEGDKIEILLPKELYNDYKTKIRGNRDFAHIIHSSLVFNALVFALNNYDKYENRLWARTLNVRMASDRSLQKFSLGDPEDSMNLAQALLGDPYKRLFTCLDRLSNNNNIEEED